MVGQMLAEQQSPAFLEQVESVRRMSIARRENDEPVDALAARLADVPLGDADVLVRAFAAYFGATNLAERSEEHTSELQSLMRISYAVFCLKKQKYCILNSYICHDYYLQ